MDCAAHIRDFRDKRIHMIGIGGSSMSGLAEMLVARGYHVTGSDRSDGYLMCHVRERGIPVFIGHASENVHGSDLVVYTAAISKDNPELTEAERLGIPCIERAWLLGQLMEGHEHAVAVCGAHGKTTTTSMLSQILLDCGRDPSIHIGGRLDAIGGSVRCGDGSLFVAEACEFNRSFLKLRPDIAVVLNIDADHLDCYRDIDEIEKTFGCFLDLIPENGLVIGNGGDERIRRIMKDRVSRGVTFGFTDECDYEGIDLAEDQEGVFSFTLRRRGEVLTEVRMSVPGEFNVLNGLAAMACACELGCDPAEAAKSLHRFVGAHRRFERTDVVNGTEIFHDYGHNPTEMRNAIHIAKKRCRGEVWAVMQPHTFSRVRTLFNDYLTCTKEADHTLVTDICAARETDPGDLNSGMLVEGMRRNGIDAVWTPSFDDTEAYLRAHCKPGDLAITMGCGDINLLNEQIHRHEIETIREKGTDK